MMTMYGVDLPDRMIRSYLSSLVDQFFKILPIRESEEPSLHRYMESFQRELIGCRALINALNHDKSFISLIAILQFLIDNDASVDVVRQEVFKAISICKKLERKYCAKEEGV